ncbi:MAG: formate--tetrahydrofolate ligase [Clostridia bacterium]|nr:formate--tetrahydrofolate ligase [Clostridia bacterium]
MGGAPAGAPPRAGTPARRRSGGRATGFPGQSFRRKRRWTVKPSAPSGAPAPAVPSLRPLAEVAAELGLDESEWEPYGREAAKVTLEALRRRGAAGPAGRLAPLPGRLVLVTAITPTSAGEGKTTTSIGLADALRRLGRRAAVALREPSLGPALGAKGGATGGGRASLVPADRINLHFTGDLHAVTAANNLLAALIDNRLHYGGQPALDPRRIAFHRALDMDDRALRRVVIGLGGPTGGVPREEEFQITAASEVMAVLCLASDSDDLEARLGRIIAGWTRDGRPVTAADLGAAPAMAALLGTALQPNLVQTLEGTPALVHGGPFANIAHGANSILATRLALATAEVTVTEAGFGSDLGAEKFADITARAGGFAPSAVVLVASLRALKLHGGADRKALDEEDLAALERGLANLDAHLRITGQMGVPVVVAVNRFPGDSEAELERVLAHCAERGVPAALSEVYARGGEGGLELAERVLEALERSPGAASFRPFYEEGLPAAETLERLARDVYGARGVAFSREAEAALGRLERAGLDRLPVCVAKTQYSLADDAALGGTPREPWTLHVRELRASAGAGFLVALTGEILTMPGLPKEPAALSIRLAADGRVEGIL